MAEYPAVTSDEVINNMVNMVEAAELLAQTLDTTTSQAMRIMLKSMQAMQMIQHGKTDALFASLQTLTGKPQ